MSYLKDMEDPPVPKLNALTGEEVLCVSVQLPWRLVSQVKALRPNQTLAESIGEAVGFFASDAP